jgi:cupredoxin-like protein
MRLLHIVALSAAVAAAASMLMPPQAKCADTAGVLAIKAEAGHFNPPQLEVTANQPFKVRVTSAEKAPIEFESFELRRERVVKPGETITVNMPALGPGTYKFFDDFHHDTPEGAIVVK